MSGTPRVRPLKLPSGGLPLPVPASPKAGFPGVGEALSLSGALYTAEAWATWGIQIEARGDLMFAPIRERFEIGRSVSAADYIRGWSRLTAIRADWAARMAGFDAVLCPTSAILPPDVARLLSDPAYFTTENLFAQRNTRIGNLMGLCALTLPTAVPMCGISLMGAADGRGTPAAHRRGGRTRADRRDRRKCNKIRGLNAAAGRFGWTAAAGFAKFPRNGAQRPRRPRQSWRFQSGFRTCRNMRFRVCGSCWISMRRAARSSR